MLLLYNSIDKKTSNNDTRSGWYGTKDEFGQKEHIQLLELLKNYVITVIALTNRLYEDNNPFTLFDCQDNKCLDARRFAASKIQSSFRKSRDYAAWKYHPEKLRKEGYFGETSDLTSNLNSNLISEKKIFPLLNQQVRIADINYTTRNRFGKINKVNKVIKINKVNMDIKYLLK